MLCFAKKLEIMQYTPSSTGCAPLDNAPKASATLKASSCAIEGFGRQKVRQVWKAGRLSANSAVAEIHA